MTTEPKIPPLPEPFGYAREWEGDVSDWNNWLFETDKNELDDRPWVHLYSNEQVAVRDKQWAERVAELEREKESMLKDRAALAVRGEELERNATEERCSRGMFVARLEMLNRSMTSADVLGLLNDCDYLAAIDAEQAKGREAVDVGSEWTPCVKLPIVVHVRHQRPGEAHVSTREGITPVKPDDLIMRGVAGEEYPIGRELFERTYTLDTTPPAQPAREWVVLTDFDIASAMSGQPEIGLSFTALCNIARAIESASREKNAGQPVVKEN